MPLYDMVGMPSYKGYRYKSAGDVSDKVSAVKKAVADLERQTSKGTAAGQQRALDAIEAAEKALAELRAHLS